MECNYSSDFLCHNALIVSKPHIIRKNDVRLVMEFIIRFFIFVLFTFMVVKIYEKRRRNEIIIESIYFVITAVIFLL